MKTHACLSFVEVVIQSKGPAVKSRDRMIEFNDLLTKSLNLFRHVLPVENCGAYLSNSLLPEFHDPLALIVIASPHILEG